MGLALRALLLGGASCAGGAAYYGGDITAMKFDAASAVGPVLRLLDAEDAHNLGIKAAAAGLFPRETRPDPPVLATQLWGRKFSNPFGLAAGFDKHAEAMDGLLGLGLGFMEIGSVTPLPQPGNPKPRAFRLSELGAVINRYGFNSEGVDAVGDRLAAYRTARQQTAPGTGRPAGVLAVNLGKNKESEDAAADYCLGASKLAQFADFLVINVSSPNTQGLRALQGRKELERLVAAVKDTRDRMSWGPAGPPPLLVKIAPDLNSGELADISKLALRLGVDGLIVSNTTIARPPDVAAHAHGAEAGGLSGKPLMESSTEVLRQVYALTRGRLPLIGCGGVASGEDAYRKIRAGASLVELYTALALQGPALIPRLKEELAACLERDGFTSVAAAVGADHR
mmetsp:Transcript_18681/g.56470  ORF Transcript_18681/g.56470 Transcript_18681/m.56470 type:complete len:397 (+) Transcript_18681:78-1268(+)